MNRLVMVSGTVLALAFAVAMQGCGSSSGDDSAAKPTGGSGNATSGGTGNSPGIGGTGTAGTAPSAGTGGSPVAPTAGASSGGTAGTGAAAGGSPSGGTAGVPGGGGTPAGGAGGMSSGGTPPDPCDVAVVKGGACTTAGSTCAKTCGVNKLGYKVETCGTPVAGTYGEGACQYASTVDLACYKETLPLAACPGVTDPGGPLSGKDACTTMDCVPCGPNYRDSGGPKAGGGACVCTAGKWQCASAKEWPPQQ